MSNKPLDLAHVKTKLSDFIDSETSKGAEEGLACEIATSLLAEVDEATENCLKNLPSLKQAILDYVLENPCGDDEDADGGDATVTPYSGIDDQGWFDVEAYPTRENYEGPELAADGLEGFTELKDAIEHANSDAYDNHYQVNVVAYGEHVKYERGEGIYSRFVREETSATQDKS